MKTIEEMTWDELVDHLTQYIHCGLLEGGGKEMKSRIDYSMQLTLRWRKAQDSIEVKK